MMLFLEIDIAGLENLEKFGLVDLIKNGYGTLTWAYWIIFVIPVIFVAFKKMF